jgi:4-hydroxy-3-methylbut-2-enyl diphosphate reductase
LLIVVGSRNSSNSNRLRELAEKQGVPAYLIDNADEFDPQWLVGRTSVGITAGASAPEVLVQQVIERLHTLGVRDVRENKGLEEKITFTLPRELR